MDRMERLRATIISTIVRDVPQRFWSDIREGARRVYADVFEQVRNEAGLIEQQRIDLLYQFRHCRMEHLLLTLAKQHEIVCSPTVLSENNRYHVFATRGSIAMTQSYVATIGAMPQPAKYRGRYAAMNEMGRTPQLNLGVEPEEVFIGKEFYGLLAHNPSGKRFSEVEQRLGMIQFCVPVQDLTAWAAELTIQEILDGYRSETRSEKPDRRLPWKDRGTEEEVGEK